MYVVLTAPPPLAWLLTTLCALSFAIFVWWCFDELNVCFILTVSVCCQAPAMSPPSSSPAHPWAYPPAAMARGLGTATQRPPLRVRWPIHLWHLVPTSTCSPAKVTRDGAHLKVPSRNQCNWTREWGMRALRKDLFRNKWSCMVCI